MLDLNNNEECGVKEFKVFNGGEAGIVGECKLRIEKKTDDSNQPDYKMYLSDSKGEVNEGFYYSTEQDGTLSVDKFKKYQAQRLINLAKGVLGNDYTFPNYKDPKEALDGVMAEVHKASMGLFRCAVAYGTTARPEQWLKFPAWGKFVQNEKFDNELVLPKNALKESITPDKVEDPFGAMGETKDDEKAPW